MPGLCAMPQQFSMGPGSQYGQRPVGAGVMHARFRLRQQGARRNRAMARCRCHAWSDKRALEPQGKNKRQALLDYAKTCKHAVIDSFADQAPRTVVEAMRASVRNHVGVLPPQFFNVQISGEADDFGKLLWSYMMAGYMFRNALFRMELRGALVHPTLPPASGVDFPAGLLSLADEQSDSLYAPGSDVKDVQGDVLRWHMENGLEKMPAAQYIAYLEGQLRSLQQENATVANAAAAAVSSSNELTDYVHSLGADAQILTSNVGQDVHDAMGVFVERMMGPIASGFSDITQCDCQELSRQLFFTCIVGYTLRSLEVKFDMASSLDEFDHPDLLL